MIERDDRHEGSLSGHGQETGTGGSRRGDRHEGSLSGHGQETGTGKSTGGARPRIRVLPPELASQIAAGEVVERPASVVKELVENALDAGARRVDVSVVRGGRELIRVVDDGCGLTEAEVRLALERHATSKLGCLEDLASIGTLGFRGEALPSIASVSRLTVTSRPEGEIAGVRCQVVAGAPPVTQEAGCPVGTTVEVEDLFFNIPARRKFLKTERTESAHVGETLLLISLTRPDVHFTFTEDTRRSLDLPRHSSLLERASASLSRRGSGLHPVRYEENGMVVHAALGSPQSAVTTARNVYLLVNGRGVRDRLLLRMLSLGYGELLDRGRYPLAVLHLGLPLGAVDVNVHPQKYEVRFADEKAVASVVRRAVAEGVRGAPWARADGAAGPMGTVVETASPTPRTYVLRLPPLSAPDAPWTQDAPGDPLRGEPPRIGSEGAQAGGSTRVAGQWGEARTAWPGEGGRAGPLLNPYASDNSDEPGPQASAVPPVLGERAGAYGQRLPEDIRSLFASPGSTDPTGRVGISAKEDRWKGLPMHDRAAAPGMDRPPGSLRHHRYLGQLFRTYLVFEGDGELILLDQHAAHERVTYSRLKEATEGGEAKTQRLLFPVQVSLDAREEALLEEQRDLLGRCGFDLELLSGRTAAIRGVPALLGACDVERLLGDVLGELAETQASDTLENAMDHLLATMACHGSVRAGQWLGDAEVAALLEALDQVELSGHCPHGRPVVVRIADAEIRRRFHRE